MNMLGKALARVGVGIVTTGLVIYVDYRMKGGPPLRELHKQIREERLEAEKVNALAKKGIEVEGTVK